jgi:hypothetical protein
MTYEELQQKIEKQVKKDYAMLAYRLPYQENKGILYADGEKIETEPYSFTKMTDIVKGVFEANYPIKETKEIGFRGEVFVSETKELEVHATAAGSLIEYKVRTRKSREAVYEI